LVGGEPGVGKSRLAAELARRTHAAGALVLYGRCDEELGAPYQPFVEAMRVAAPLLGARRLRDVRGVDELARLVPEIVELVPDAGAATRADAETERFALFGAVTQLLVAASTVAPVLLVLDDLHWNEQDDSDAAASRLAQRR
jgi:predicted ATPase